jgi:hypothetical protein
MKELDRRGVMQFVLADERRPAHIRFRPEWEWCHFPEFLALLDG